MKLTSMNVCRSRARMEENATTKLTATLATATTPDAQEPTATFQLIVVNNQSVLTMEYVLATPRDSHAIVLGLDSQEVLAKKI